MTVTIDLPPQVEQAYRELAAVTGVPVDTLVRDAVVASIPIAPASGMIPEDPEEWIREFKAWAASHSGLPVLSDEAMSREFIYAERGL